MSRLVTHFEIVVDPILWPLKVVCRFLTDRNPQRPTRNPGWCIQFLLLSALTGPAAFGLTPLPPTLQVDNTFGRAAAAALAVGGLLVGGCQLWKDRDQSLPVEQIGLTFAGWGALCYAVALVMGPPSWSAAQIGIAMALSQALAATARYIQIWYWQLPEARR